MTAGKAHLNFIAAVGPFVPAISLAVIMDKNHRSYVYMYICMYIYIYMYI